MHQQRESLGVLSSQRREDINDILVNDEIKDRMIPKEDNLTSN